jgi:hypothetical protein
METAATTWWSEVLGGGAVLTAGAGRPALSDALSSFAPGTPVTLVARGWRGRLRLRAALRRTRLTHRVDYLPLPAADAPLVVTTTDSASMRVVLHDLVSVPPGTSAHALATAAVLGARMPGADRLIRLLLPDRIVTGVTGAPA